MYKMRKYGQLRYTRPIRPKYRGLNGVIPQRRTLVVLAALVAGMTVTSSALLVLEPGPVAPISGLTLQSIEQGNASRPEQKLFEYDSEQHPWQAIVIHDSGSLHGSSRTINRVHEQLGRGGLGYHFVINNGSEKADGLIEVGYRWQHQFGGKYLEGDGSDWFNRNAIGICLIGDGDRQSLTRSQLRELVWLVQQLQNRFGISKEYVFMEIGSGEDGPSKRFPYAWFRQQLLNPSQH